MSIVRPCPEIDSAPVRASVVTASGILCLVVPADLFPGRPVRIDDECAASAEAGGIRVKFCPGTWAHRVLPFSDHYDRQFGLVVHAAAAQLGIQAGAELVITDLDATAESRSFLATPAVP